MPSVRDEWRPRLLLVAAALTYVGLAVAVLLTPEPSIAVMLLLVGFGVVVLAAALPATVQRVRGILSIPRIARTLTAAQGQIESGRAEEARAALEELAPELVGRLAGYRVVVLTVLAYTYVHTGDVEHARAILDTIEAGGWHRSFTMRKTRAAVVGGQIILHAQLGDLPRAERMLALLRPGDSGIVVDVARVALAARRGEAIDVSALSELASRTYPPGRANLQRLVRILLLAQLSPDDPSRATHEAALRASTRRPSPLLRDHWPELHRVVESALAGDEPAPE